MVFEIFCMCYRRDYHGFLTVKFKEHLGITSELSLVFITSKYKVKDHTCIT